MCSGCSLCGKILNVDQVTINLTCNLRLFFGGTCDYKVPFTDGRNTLSYSVKSLASLNGLRPRIGCQLFTFIHREDGFISSRTHLLHHRLDVRRRCLGPMGKRAHLIRYNSEPTPLLPRPGRFDGCVQGQEISLLGNGSDHIKNFSDLVDAGGKHLNLGS